MLASDLLNFQVKWTNFNKPVALACGTSLRWNGRVFPDPQQNRCTKCFLSRRLSILMPMRRDAHPFAGMNATGVAAPRSIQRDVLSVQARGQMARLGPVDSSQVVRWSGSPSSGAMAASKTTRIHHSRELASAPVLAAVLPMTCVAGEPKTSSNGLPSIAGLKSRRHPICCKASNAVRLFSLSVDTQNTKLFRPRFGAVVVRSTAGSGSRLRQQMAVGRESVGHSPGSQELTGVSLVGLTIFGGSWPVRWREIKSLSPPFVLLV